MSWVPRNQYSSLQGNSREMRGVRGSGIFTQFSTCLSGSLGEPAHKTTSHRLYELIINSLVLDKLAFGSEKADDQVIDTHLIL